MARLGGRWRPGCWVAKVGLLSPAGLSSFPHTRQLSRHPISPNLFAPLRSTILRAPLSSVTRSFATSRTIMSAVSDPLHSLPEPVPVLTPPPLPPALQTTSHPNPWAEPLSKPAEELNTYLATLPDFVEGSKR